MMRTRNLSFLLLILGFPLLLAADMIFSRPVALRITGGQHILNDLPLLVMFTTPLAGGFLAGWHRGWFGLLQAPLFGLSVIITGHVWFGTQEALGRLGDPEPVGYALLFLYIFGFVGTGLAILAAIAAQPVRSCYRH